MLLQEQIKQIKEQLIKQITATFPEDKKNLAISQIQSMNPEEIEEFLIKNNVIKSKSPGQGIEKPQCIFCSIIEGDINSYKIDENKSTLAILEINPISKGHVLILPKEHNPDSKKIPKQAFSLAEKIAEKIKIKLKPKKVEVSVSSLMGHSILNVLPIYKNETLNSEKYQASPEELSELQQILEKKSKPKKEKLQKPKSIEKKETKSLWLPKRIP